MSQVKVDMTFACTMTGMMVDGGATCLDRFVVVCAMLRCYAGLRDGRLPFTRPITLGKRYSAAQKSSQHWCPISMLTLSGQCAGRWQHRDADDSWPRWWAWVTDGRWADWASVSGGGWGCGVGGRGKGEGGRGRGWGIGISQYVWRLDKSGCIDGGSKAGIRYT